MDLKYVSFGIGLSPFWWQLGDVSQHVNTRMIAVGPLRISWRWQLRSSGGYWTKKAKP